MASSIISIEEEKKDEKRRYGRDWLSTLMERHGHRDIWVLAPMVDQSDLPFRKLVRKYGCTLCFTPMIHAKMLLTHAVYRRKFLIRDDPTDRPLIAQLCGNDADTLIANARLIEPYCDAIDLNCGCPQMIARRGNYGAFLLESPDSLVETVKQLVKAVNVPVCVKVRLVPTSDSSCEAPQTDWNASIDLYRRLVREAGIAMLTVHGRTRHHKGPTIGNADWDAVRRVVEELGSELPILSNGSIDSLEQAQECRQITGVDGIMSSEAILEYPALFAGGERISRVQLAYEYLQLAKEYPPELGGQGSGTKCMRAHIHRFLDGDFEGNNHFRQALIAAKGREDLWDIVDQVAAIQKENGHDVASEKLSWYMRYRTERPDGLSNRHKAERIGSTKSRLPDSDDEEEDVDGCAQCVFDTNDNDGDY